MPFSLSLPVAISAIRSLIKFRDRVDTILSLNKATDPLPFLLPATPTDHGPHLQAMLAFFRSNAGSEVLILRGLETVWSKVSPNPVAANANDLETLCRVYYEAHDITPKLLGPDLNRFRLARGSTREAQLAFHVVESDRLSRNPAVTRVLLAAADTLLEFGAAHANLFISDPRTRPLIESLLREFAEQRDWDDAGAGLIFKTLLGSTALAALQNQQQLPDTPLAKIFFAALHEVEREFGANGADVVARLVTREGFHALLSRLLLQSAQHPALLPGQPLLHQSLAAMLKTAGENLDSLLLRQPGAIENLLHAGIATAAASATPLLQQKIGHRPLLDAVFRSLLHATQKAAAQNELFAQITDGELLATLYKAALRSVADHPNALANAAKLDAHVAKLIAMCADEFARTDVADAFSSATLRVIGVRALESVAAEPAFLARHDDFTARVLASALAATAAAAKTPFTVGDLADIADHVARTAASNLALLDMDERLRSAIAAMAQTLSDQGLVSIATPAARRALFFAGLEALATNPKIWDAFAARDLAQPVVIAVVHALAQNPANLLAGPALIPAFQEILEAAARRGRAFIDDSATPADLEIVLTAALATAEQAIGDSIDAKTLPLYLRRVALAFLAAPFDPKKTADLAALLQQQLPAAA